MSDRFQDDGTRRLNKQRTWCHRSWRVIIGLSLTVKVLTKVHAGSGSGPTLRVKPVPAAVGSLVLLFRTGCNSAGAAGPESDSGGGTRAQHQRVPCSPRKTTELQKGSFQLTKDGDVWGSVSMWTQTSLCSASFWLELFLALSCCVWMDQFCKLWPDGLVRFPRDVAAKPFMLCKYDATAKTSWL